jgi:FkbM family methyltransferase
MIPRPAAVSGRVSLVARAAKLIARPLGLEISRQRPDDSIHARRGRVIRNAGVQVVLDVGANAGQYARDLRRLSEFTGRIVSFEPVASAYAQLAMSCAHDPNWSCHQVAMGAVSGQRDINVTAGTTTLSSFLAPRARDEIPLLVSTAHTQRVSLVRLDDVFGDHVSSDERAMLKLDVQGYEDQVLRGGGRTLELVSVLECELSLIPLYDGQPGTREMIDLIDDAGFVPVGVQPNFVDRDTGHVVDADFLFRRRADL